MKNSFTPYYNIPDCYSQYSEDTYGVRPNGIFPGSAPTGFPSIAPTGVPTGIPTQNQLQPITPTTEPQAITLESTEYMNGYLRTQIGKKVRIEFLIGTGTLVDKMGVLLNVGANFITIRQSETDDVIVCDFYTIKFVTFYL